MEEPILAGIRVIDCGTYIAGPAAAAVLSDFGATVIKIERPPHGDPYRYLSRLPLLPQSEHLYCWMLDNRNKKSVALDLGDPAQREALLRLTDAADIFITNYQPELIEKFGLGYETLRDRNPRLIYAWVSGYGGSGDDAGRPGYDLTAYWARSGLMDCLHNGDAEPCLSPAGFGDHPTAMSLVGAILLALYRRERTGQGAKVSTSLAANGVWSNGCLVQAALVGARFTPHPTRHQTLNPLVNHYVARDGRRFLLCCLDSKKDWPNLCRAIDHPDLLADSRFHTPEARAVQGAGLVTLLDAAFAARDMDEWRRRFAQFEIIYGPVPSTEEVAADPQLHANGVFPLLEDAPFPTVTSPIEIEGVVKVRPRLAPAPGQHNDELLGR